MYHISPSLLCSDIFSMKENIEHLNELGIDWYHVDIMDGNFVPNFAFGTDFLRSLIALGTKPFYVHMMVTRPQDYIQTFAELGTEYYCFHYETTNNPFRLCQEIKKNGMKPAIALNPATSIEVLRYFLDELEVVTLMAIEPGFSGQKFMSHTYQKISLLKSLIGERKILIEVDGGADCSISKNCIEIGCDVVVGGYFNLFRTGQELEDSYREFQKALKE